MELRASEHLPAGVPRVAEILADPDFYRATLDPVGGAAGQIAGDVAVTGSPSGPFSVAIRRTMAAHDLPKQVQGYLPGGLDVRQVNVWDAPDAGGSRQGTVTMEIVGAPVRLRGTVALVPGADGGCELVYVANLRATIPFVGATIEQAAAPAIRAALRAEHDELLRCIGT
jgi:hypothetical protein